MKYLLFGILINRVFLLYGDDLFSGKCIVKVKYRMCYELYMVRKKRILKVDIYFGTIGYIIISFPDNVTVLDSPIDSSNGCHLDTCQTIFRYCIVNCILT